MLGCAPEWLDRPGAVMTTTWLTPKAAEAYAKCDATLRRAVKAKRLQAYRVNGGRCVRFRVEDVDQWLSSSPINEGTAS